MSLDNKIYKGDVGTIFNLDAKVNIADATVHKISMLKPNNTKIDLNAWLTGSIGNIEIANAGSGYQVDDELTVVYNGGSVGKLTVTAVDGSGAITAVEVYNGGSGYQIANNITVTGGNGNGFVFNITSLAAATILKYVIQPGEFDQAGVYKMQAYVETPSWKGRGETVSFEVFDIFQ
jgi:hypothetical protein